MYLEASIFPMSTGDMAALISAADRARELAEGRDPALELLAVIVIGEAYIALGERSAGEELLRVAEPFLLGGDPMLAPPEVLGMAGHARSGPSSSTARRRSSRGSCGPTATPARSSR